MPRVELFVEILDLFFTYFFPDSVPTYLWQRELPVYIYRFYKSVPWSATKNEHRRMSVTFFPVNDSRRASDMFYGRSVRCFGDNTGVKAARQPIGTLLLPQLKSAHGRTSIITVLDYTRRAGWPRRDCMCRT